MAIENFRDPTQVARWADQSDKEASQEIIIRRLRRKISNTERALSGFHAMARDGVRGGMTAADVVEAFRKYFPGACV